MKIHFGESRLERLRKTIKRSCFRLYMPDNKYYSVEDIAMMRPHLDVDTIVDWCEGMPYCQTVRRPMLCEIDEIAAAELNRSHRRDPDTEGVRS